jgi:hypothetical protein
MTWLRDARFWVTVFIVLFWPAVLLWHFVGLAILIALVAGGVAGVHWLDRRASDGAA